MFHIHTHINIYIHTHSVCAWRHLSACRCLLAAAEGFQGHLYLGLREITIFDKCKFQMPPVVDDKGDRCPALDDVKCFCTYLFPLFFFFSPLGGANISPAVLGPFCRERLRISLHDSAHKSLLQSGKERSDLANDCSTFLDEVWNRPPRTHALCRLSLQPAVHLAQPLQDFLSAIREQGIVVRVACSAKPGSHFISARDKCR